MKMSNRHERRARHRTGIADRQEQKQKRETGSRSAIPASPPPFPDQASGMAPIQRLLACAYPELARSQRR